MVDEAVSRCRTHLVWNLTVDMYGLSICDEVTITFDCKPMKRKAERITTYTKTPQSGSSSEMSSLIKVASQGDVTSAGAGGTLPEE